MQKKKAILSPDYFPLLIDKDRFKVLMILFQMCAKLEPVLKHELNMQFVEKTFIDLLDEVSDKEHKLGWCQDPNCGHKVEKG